MEIWKPILFFEESHEVSNFGRVRSLDRFVPHSNGKVMHYKSKIKNQRISVDGYAVVTLRQDGTNANPEVHALVAQAFLGNRPSQDHWIVHLNGDRSDNCVDNLMYQHKSINYNNLKTLNLIKRVLKVIR